MSVAEEMRSGSLARQIGRQVLTVEEAGHILGLGRTSAYDAVRRGEIPSIRLGRRLVVPLPALEKLLSAGVDRE